MCTCHVFCFVACTVVLHSCGTFPSPAGWVGGCVVLLRSNQTERRPQARACPRGEQLIRPLAHTHEAHDEIIIHMVVVATVRFQTPLSIIDLSRVKVVREQGGGKEDIEHTPGAMEPKLTGKRHDRNLVVWRAVVRTVAWERHDGENWCWQCVPARAGQLFLMTLRNNP